MLLNEKEYLDFGTQINNLLQNWKRWSTCWRNFSAPTCNSILTFFHCSSQISHTTTHQYSSARRITFNTETTISELIQQSIGRENPYQRRDRDCQQSIPSIHTARHLRSRFVDVDLREIAKKKIKNQRIVFVSHREKRIEQHRSIKKRVSYLPWRICVTNPKKRDREQKREREIERLRESSERD